MKKILYFISATLLFASLSFLNSCSQEDEMVLNNDNVVESKSDLLLDDAVSEPIIPIEVDSVKFAEYMEFKKQNPNLFEMTYLMPSIQTKSAVSTRGLPDSYYVESTLSDNIYALRDIPFSLSVRGGGNTGSRYLVTNGKGKELTFASRPSLRPANNKFYFRAVPPSSGMSYILYSATERTPISVGSYKNNPNNYILFALNDGAYTSSMMSSFDFMYANTSGYLRWQSDALIAQGNSGLWYDIYYKVAEARNDNKTGFSQYTGSPTQEWVLTPDQSFTIDDISYFDSYNTRIISIGEEKVTKAAENDFSSKVMPETWLLFDRNVKEESAFLTKDGINFRLINNNKYRLPYAFNGNIITLPAQNRPLVGIYTENKQYIDKKLDSYIKLNDMQPRERCEAVFTYTRYEIEVDFSVEVSCIYNSVNRKTKLNGVWRGVVYVDERRPVYYKFYNIDTNELLETGYLDISGTAPTPTKSAANTPTIKRTLK